MSTCRPKGRGFEFVVKRRNILPKPIYLTFDTESEGRTYCARPERLLDQGIVPDEFLKRDELPDKITGVITEYRDAVSISAADQEILKLAEGRIGDISMIKANCNWAQSWVSEMKRVQNLAPSTIRHHVGAMKWLSLL